MMQYPWNFGDNSMNPKTIYGYLAELRAVFVSAHLSENAFSLVKYTFLLTKYIPHFRE